jgi:hypothetical protein
LLISWREICHLADLFTNMHTLFPYRRQSYNPGTPPRRTRTSQQSNSPPDWKHSCDRQWAVDSLYHHHHVKLAGVALLEVDPLIWNCDISCHPTNYRVRICTLQHNLWKGCQVAGKSRTCAGNNNKHPHRWDKGLDCTSGSWR